LQAASGQISLLAQRKSIAKVIADPTTPSTLKSRLQYAQAAREFASHELGLPDNKSYRSYVDLKRDYVLWNVFAALEFSVDPKRWCFPVAGCVVYRGYFKEPVAQHYADKLRREGFDVVVSGVPAYSTLGHFNDPVISTMLHWSDAQVAATLFHELAHQLMYVKGDSAFNEAFATVVADAGIKRWLQQQNHQNEWLAWQAQEQRSNEFSELLLQTREQLRALYALNEITELKREHKAQLLGDLKSHYAQLKQQWNGYNGYDQWMDRPLTNADFIAIATYQQCIPRFETLLHKVDDDLSRFYAAVKDMALHDKVKRQHFCDKE
jgi:predicted aminopeptidase